MSLVTLGLTKKTLKYNISIAVMVEMKIQKRLVL